MKRLLFVPLAFLLASTGAAQTPSEPNLVLSIVGGVATGGRLWTIERQPLDVLCSPPQGCGIDTLRLTRDLTPSVIAGIAATYFREPHLGFTLDVFFMDMPLDDTCEGVFYNPDAGGDPVFGTRNNQVCNNITSSSPSTSVISAMAGVVVRAAGARSISPYLRGSAGIVGYSSGAVATSGLFVEGDSIRSRSVLIDENPKTLRLGAQVAAGFTARMSAGYQFRLELRDVMAPLDRVAGPAPISTLRPPQKTALLHRFALIFGLDVVLEKQRGRRY